MPLGMGMPTECREVALILKDKYGEPPADLKWGYLASRSDEILNS